MYLEPDAGADLADTHGDEQNAFICLWVHIPSADKWAKNIKKNFATVNKVMEEVFPKPYPARAAVGVKALPKGAQFEAEAVMVIGD